MSISIKILTKAAYTQAAPANKDEMHAYVKEEMAKVEAQMVESMNAFKSQMSGEMHAVGISMYAKWKEEMRTYEAVEASVSKVQEKVEKKVQTWTEMAKKAKQKVEAVDKEVKECAPWIVVVKKNKGMPSNQTEVMNATLEEEAKRKPNKGSVKNRNQKKRMALRDAFIKAEAQKRIAQCNAADAKRLEARTKCWKERAAWARAWKEKKLAELKEAEAKQALDLAAA
ncbi:hypothetical protein L7F22_030105 [Adiantum nelumboides]|nr:hypothetical protein [Adiantum nelumboides]